MAVQRDSITVVPPDGETVVVDILEDDVSLGTVHADRSKTRMLTLPLTITGRTSFYVPVGSGPYDVSVKLGDDEIAGTDGTPVTVSSFPAEIHARIDAAELGSVAGASGGSSAGAPCWFAGGATHLLSTGDAASPEWSVSTDGVAAGTDVIVHVADDTALECVTAGTYLVTFGTQGYSGTTTGAEIVSQYIKLNGDSVGPAYNFGAGEVAGRPVNLPTIPLVLAEGDLLRLSISLGSSSTDGDTGQSVAALIRIA